MTSPPRNPTDTSENWTESDFGSEADRAEAEWLLARERDPGAPVPSAQLGAEHAELRTLLSSLPDALHDDAWQDAILKQVSPAPHSPVAPQPPWWRRRWIQWSAGGGLAMAVAFAIWLLLRPTPPELEVTTISRLDKRTNDIAVGDQLLVKASPRGNAELRVFRSNGEMLARCPSGPACTVASSGELRIELVLDAPDHYRVVLASGLKQRLPDGDMNTYIDIARARGAHIVVRDIEAR